MPKNFINPNKLPFKNVEDAYMPQMEVELFGQWDQAVRTVQRLGKVVKESGIKAQLRIGKEIVKSIKGHLRNQDLPWKALAEGTLDNKKKYKLDRRTLIAWGEYYHAVEVWQKGNRHMVYIGVKRGKYTRTNQGKRSRLEIAQIAYLHEFSTGKRFPRRPLWNPTIRELGGATGVKAMYVKYIKEEALKRGIKLTGKIF